MKNARTLTMLFALALWPAVALADNTTLALAHDSVLGEMRADNLSASGVAGDIGYFRYALTLNRSYVAACWIANVDGGSFCSLDWRDGADLSVSAGGDVEPFISFNGDSDAFQPTATGTYYVRIQNGGIAAGTAHLMVVETTLFSPWYFVSPSAGYDGFVEIRNNTAQTLGLTVRAYNNLGVIVGSMLISIAGNGNTAIQVGASLGVTGGSGSVTIAHNGTPGAIAANITTLSAATGLSFDAPFQPRMVYSTFGF